ncbi:MAG TPA: ABC transporter permease [Candidatus Limnocylindria bacterium]
MKVFVIAWTSMRRTLRDRMGLFFIIVLPMILIVVLGMTYGGMGRARVGVSMDGAGPLAEDLVDGMSMGVIALEVRRYETPAELRDAVEGGYVEIGLIIPPGYDAALRGGQSPTIEYVSQAKNIASVARTPVDEAIAEQAGQIRAARLAADVSGISFDAALAAAREAQPGIAGVDVGVEQVAERDVNPSGFTQGAHSQVILFTFLTSMTGAVVLVMGRRLGVSRRIIATPTSAATVIAGEALGRYAFALFQGAFIVIGSALLFGVDWMDPWATAAIIGSFALVAAGAAMMIGALVTNESQVSAFGAGLGMMLGLLGGTMVPLEVFPEFMQGAARAVPHAWAMDAWAYLLDNERAGVMQVLPQIGVLLAFAVALLSLAIWRFRRALVSGA